MVKVVLVPGGDHVDGYSDDGHKFLWVLMAMMIIVILVNNHLIPILGLPYPPPPTVINIYLN